jgi:hypothetical protein
MSSTWVALLALSTLGFGSPALAQERLDSRYRGWLELVVFSGDLYSPDDWAVNRADVISLTPVLRAELELSPLQVGLDLPFAFGDATFFSTLLNDEPSFERGSIARLGNVTWHADYVWEVAPLRVSAGLAFAISTTKERAPRQDGPAASYVAAVAGVEARGLWNAWWYATGAWGLVLPVSAEWDTPDYELGAEGALAWLITRGERANQGVLQIGGHGAAVVRPFVLGARVAGVQALDRRVIGEERFQLSVEPYVELRVSPAWFGLGFHFPIDKPLGWFEAGDELWGLELRGGASY